MAWFGDADPRERRTPRDAVGSTRLWPFVLTVFFGILFAGIADRAWIPAPGPTAPWFPGAVSAQVYTSPLTTATIATLILASLAASKLGLLDSRARAAAGRQVDDRANAPRLPVEVPRSVVLAPSRTTRAEGLDQILSELERFAEGPMVEVRDRQSGDPVPMSFAASVPRTAGAGRSRSSKLFRPRRLERMPRMTGPRGEETRCTITGSPVFVRLLPGFHEQA